MEIKQIKMVYTLLYQNEKCINILKYLSDLKWRHNIKSDVVINKLNPVDDIMNILNIKTQTLRVSEMNEYLSQFDCNLDKINCYR